MIVMWWSCGGQVMIVAPFFFSCQHAIFLLVIVVAWVIPDVPESVKNEIKREKVLALKAHLGQSGDPQRQPDTGLLDEHHLEVERRAKGKEEMEHFGAVIRRNE